MKKFRYIFISIFTIVNLVLLNVGCSTKSDNTKIKKNQPEQPNILLIIADDLTWNDIQPYGNNEVKTPNLAKLAQEGMTLYGMYTSTAMCSPTRQQLYTGLYPVRNGAYPNHSWTYKGIKSLPDYLRPLGYRVGIAGKEDFGPPSVYPFEKVAGTGQLNALAYQNIRDFISKKMINLLL